jgi:LuxR family maltose regulon positive regulatory protein
MEGSSNMLLLSTKLKIPAPRKNYVIRSALFEKLSQCNDMSVIFVRGGAGTGKTTLLSSFLRETKLKNVCWLSLDASNSNVYSFWYYFTAAVSKFWQDGDNFLAVMQSNPDASHMENLLIMLINRLCSEDDFYMVLDDIHYICDAALPFKISCCTKGLLYITLNSAF